MIEQRPNGLKNKKNKHTIMFQERIHRRFEIEHKTPWRSQMTGISHIAQTPVALSHTSNALTETNWQVTGGS